MSAYKHVVWHELPLGKFPDSEIARAFGLNKQYIGRARKRLGIPPFNIAPKVTPLEKTDPADKRAWEHLLGDIPDAEISRRFKTPVRTIRAARREAGLMSVRDLIYVDWMKIDFGLADEVLASRHRIAVAVIKRERERALKMNSK